MSNNKPRSVVVVKVTGRILWKDDSNSSDEVCTMFRGEPLFVLCQSNHNPDMLKVIDSKGRIGFVFQWRVEQQ